MLGLASMSLLMLYMMKDFALGCLLDTFGAAINSRR